MDIQVVNLLKYNNSTDYLLMGTEFLFIVFTIYYFIQEWLEYRASGSAYFADLGRYTSNFSIKIMRHSPVSYLYLLHGNLDQRIPQLTNA
jgi:hypothetical protein